jgi:hypothetical protein
LLAQAAAPECICEIVTSRAMTREVRWRRFVPSGRLHRALTKCSNKERDKKILRPRSRPAAIETCEGADKKRASVCAGLLETSIELFIGRWPT